jgi:hypothetical protein
MSLSNAISQAQQTADLEMTAYLSQMGDTERGVYAGANSNAAINKVLGTKSDRFNYLSEDLMHADNNITSTAYYIARTQDLTEMAGDIDTVAAKQVSAININSGISARQNEINEWANHNKLDTLFFLQILFISLTFISVLVFLNSNGLISNYLLNLFMVLTAALSVFVLISRAKFTHSKRDSRYWNKNRFDRPNVAIAPTETTQPKQPPLPLPGAPPPKEMSCSLK